jgi:hypothetical protein
LFSFYFALFITPLFLFSDIFLPIADRRAAFGFWLWVDEALPLLDPVRLTRAAFGAELSWILIWDLVYIVVISGVLLVVAARVTRRRLSI